MDFFSGPHIIVLLIIFATAVGVILLFLIIPLLLLIAAMRRARQRTERAPDPQAIGELDSGVARMEQRLQNLEEILLRSSKDRLSSSG